MDAQSDKVSARHSEVLPEVVSLETTPADEGVVVLVAGVNKIPAHGSAQVARVDTPVIPEIHPSYIISNAGRADKVTAVYYWSHSFTSKWFEYSKVTIEAGEQAKLQAPSNSLYYSKVVVYNDTADVAAVTVERAR